MKKEEMLHELEERLKGLPADDREKLVELYQDLLEVANENRKYVDLEANVTIRNDSYRNMSRIILSSISLFFFNLIFVFGPAVAVFAVYLSLFVVSASFVLSPLFAASQVAIGGFTTLEFFLSLILCGLGILLGAGMVKVGKSLYRIFSKYVHWNMKLIKGE